MATRANEETEKGATRTRSPESILRDDAPQLRTIEAIHRKQEQVFHGLASGSISPKMGEQLNMAIKGLFIVPRMQMQYHSMLLKYGIEKVESVKWHPLVRDVIGLEKEQTS